MNPAEVLQKLADAVYEQDGYDEIGAALCTAATTLIPGCDHASLMIRDSGRYVTAAASSDIAATIDQYERDLREGPCVDAIDEESPQIDNDLTVRSQWPKLARVVVAATPVRAAMAFRIRTGTSKTGALNLFANQAGVFGAESIDQAVIVAAFASTMVSARLHKEEAATLRDGLSSSREIGKAIGLLMSIHNIDDNAAFEVLKSASQRANTKLSELARQLVEKHRKSAV